MILAIVILARETRIRYGRLEVVDGSNMAASYLHLIQ